MSPFLPTQIEAEKRSIKKILLNQPLQDGGGTTCRNSRVGQTKDTIKLGIDKISARLSLTQAKFLVGNGNALNLEGNKREKSA